MIRGRGVEAEPHEAAHGERIGRNVDGVPGAEIIVGVGGGNESRVRVFDATPQMLADFLAFPTLEGGVTVGSTD